MGHGYSESCGDLDSASAIECSLALLKARKDP